MKSFGLLLALGVFEEPYDLSCSFSQIECIPILAPHIAHVLQVRPINDVLLGHHVELGLDPDGDSNGGGSGEGTEVKDLDQRQVAAVHAGTRTAVVDGKVFARVGV